MNSNRLAACIVVGFLVVVVVYYWWNNDNGGSSSSNQSSSNQSSSSNIQSPKKKAPNYDNNSNGVSESNKLIPKIISKEESKEFEEDLKDKEEIIDDGKMDEGVIKYNCEWTKGDIKYSSIKQLLFARNKLHDLKLIDVYKHNGIGFGNISQRISNNNNGKVSFYVTGTQTSSIDNDKMNETHFSIVNDYDISQNKLYCIGPIRASSESMTHATIYQLSDKIQCVVHIHNEQLWKKCVNKLPTTNKSVQYGTPQMAKEVERLYKNNIMNVQKIKIFVMGGHQDGIISFGDSVENATNLIIKTYKQYCGDNDNDNDNDNNKVSGNINDRKSSGEEVESIDSTISGEEESTTTDSNGNGGGNKNMNINIIDDYATPVLTSQQLQNDENNDNNKDNQNGGKNNDFVEVDSDKLRL